MQVCKAKHTKQIIYPIGNDEKCSGIFPSKCCAVTPYELAWEKYTCVHAYNESTQKWGEKQYEKNIQTVAKHCQIILSNT